MSFWTSWFFGFTMYMVGHAVGWYMCKRKMLRAIEFARLPELPEAHVHEPHRWV
jgi:hypothetical protein